MMFYRGFHRSFQEKVLRELDEIRALLERLLIEPVGSFIFQGQGDSMDINSGQSTTLTATPLAAPVPPATVGNVTTLPSGDIPTWTVSDSTKVTAKPSSDGLSLNVVVLPTAAPGDVVFTITDGVILNAQGVFTLTIPVPAAAQEASFVITASTPA
jgi:hypothetical protein